ncbi:MAG TPA: hypothetical protein VG734_01645 [Lacunisphaera sp.]|nr:hypothetical protein [Lacunisphaera sp.]
MTASRSGAITTAQEGVKTAAAGAPGSTKRHDGPGGKGEVGQAEDVVDVTGPGASTRAFIARVPVPGPVSDAPRVAVVRALAEAIVAAVTVGDVVGASAAAAGLSEMLQRLLSGEETSPSIADVRHIR